MSTTIHSPVRSSTPTLSNESVLALLESLSIEPICKSGEPAPIRSAHDLSLSFDTPDLSRAMVRSGVNAARLHDTGTENRFPRFRVNLDKRGRETLCQMGLVYGAGVEDPRDHTLDCHYRIEIQQDQLQLRLQKIIGSKHLAVISGDVRAAFVQRAAELIAERDLAYAPAQVELAEKAREAVLGASVRARRVGAPA